MRVDPLLRNASSRGGACVISFVALVIILVAVFAITPQQGAQQSTARHFAQFVSVSHEPESREVFNNEEEHQERDDVNSHEEAQQAELESEENNEEERDDMDDMNVLVAPNRVRMVHVGKTGGQTVREFFIHNIEDFEYRHVSKVDPSWFVRDWLSNNHTITFVSVRDPSERLASAYTYRKHTCNESAREQRQSTAHKCSIEERLLFNYCYTTLDAFASQECDGYLCHQNFTEHDIPNLDEANICNKTLNQILLLSAPDAKPPLSGHIGMGLAWYFSSFDRDLLDTVIYNNSTDTSMSPLWVVRNDHMAEDINLMNEAHVFRDELLITKLSAPNDKSDLRRYIAYANERNISGLELGHWNSDYEEVRLRRELPPPDTFDKNNTLLNSSGLLIIGNLFDFCIRYIYICVSNTCVCVYRLFVCSPMHRKRTRTSACVGGD